VAPDRDQCRNTAGRWTADHASQANADHAFDDGEYEDDIKKAEIERDFMLKVLMAKRRGSSEARLQGSTRAHWRRVEGRSPTSSI
jgi:hypothetical protein